MNTLLDAVLTACAVPVSFIAAGALWKLWSWLGFQATAQDRANMEGEIQAALSVGIKQVLPMLREGGWHDPKLHAVALDTARNYFLERFPDRTTQIMEAAHLTPSRVALIETLSGRLSWALATAAQPMPEPVVISKPEETLAPDHPLPQATWLAGGSVPSNVKPLPSIFKVRDE